MFVFIIACFYLLLSKTTIHEALSSITVLEQGIFPIEKESIGILFFVDIENVHRWNSCRVRSWAKMCCFLDEPFIDCCTDSIYGDNIESVMPTRRETLIYVMPTLYQHDQIGYCNFVIDYRCAKQTWSTQLNINIPFDTKLRQKKKQDYLKKYKDQKKTNCKFLDEDALNKCAPVHCDLKYSGRRQYFDARYNKCVSAPNCRTNIHKELPDIVYVPDSNICRDLDQPVIFGDIYAIRMGLGVVSEPKQIVKTSNIKVQVKSNCSTISQNLILLKNLMTGNLCPVFEGDSSAYSKCCKDAMLSICAWIIHMCVLLMSVICCLHTVIWLLRKSSKEKIKEFFKKCLSKIRKVKVRQQPSRLSKSVTQNLLKEVIVRDLPLELRGSVEEICDRINREIGRKKRYRLIDLNSQINLMEVQSDSTDATSSGRYMPDDEE